jgi:hypothetical protein
MKWLEILMFLVQGIPEMSGAVALSLALAGVPLRWRIIVPYGVVLVIIIYAIRALPVTFGLHTIAALLLMVVFIAKTTNVSPVKSVIFVTISMVTLSLLELFIHKLLFAMTKIELQVLMSNKVLWSLFGLPQAIILILLALLVSRFRKPVQGAWKI